MKDYYPFGQALAIAKIDDCRPLEYEDLDAAFLDYDFDITNNYALVLKDVELIKPFKVKGQQRFFNVDHEIERLGIYPKKEDDCMEVLNYWLDNKIIKRLP